MIENDRLARAGSRPLDFILKWGVLVAIVAPFVLMQLRGVWNRLRPVHLVIAAALPTGGQRYVLVEAVTSPDGRTDYNAAGRLSMASGMPAVIAWLLHEEQWHGGHGPLG